MKSKILLLTLLAVVVGAALFSRMVADFQRSVEPWRTSASVPAAPAPAEPLTRVVVATNSPPAAVEETVVSNQKVQIEALTAEVDPNSKPPTKAPKIMNAAKAKPDIQDPVARVALSFVGMDAYADAYWYQAINNPNLPAEERKDLIEDLNEDGLSDPHHPAPGDMPLIVNRLLLIEELAPYAMDQVDLDAFKEAHKDLVDMLNGKSVQ